MIRLSTKLEELNLDEIESKMVIEARNIDVESRWNLDSEHPNIRRALIVEEPIIHLKGAESNIPIRDPKRRATRMHQVDSVMARAGPEEGIIDSGASAHITGIKTLLMDYKEVATTTVTVANKDILL